MMPRFPKAVTSAVLALCCCCSAFAADTATPDTPKVRARVIIDNDFGGDPDGLFALAQHLLSPSVQITGIIGSHHYQNGFYGLSGSAQNACAAAKELLTAMNLDGKIPIYQGSEARIEDPQKPVDSEGARYIVREAMRDDGTTPLYLACGAGLTEVASAYLMEPRIATRLRLVWIGGPEYDGPANPPPGKRQTEYNLGIDLKAAQVVYNQSNIPIWQIPRDTYRQAMVSRAELQYRMNPAGKLAAFLFGKLDYIIQRSKNSRGETYILGDSPLVLLTALQSSWEPDPSSSKYVNMPAPRITDSGTYEPDAHGRTIRVYTNLDTRLLFEDLYAKVAAFDRAAGNNPSTVPQK
jgi:inosine-uridine nucleoside N-ribohydrolase